MDKPAKPWKSLEECRQRVGVFMSEDLRRSKTVWPCHFCHGRGKVVHPDEEPDVVEGYKMARRIPCPVCNGTKQIPKSLFIERVWKPAMQRYKVEHEEWLKYSRVRKKALTKLTKYEKAVLGLTR